jgi:hypothetical protein
MNQPPVVFDKCEMDVILSASRAFAAATTAFAVSTLQGLPAAIVTAQTALAALGDSLVVMAAAANRAGEKGGGAS